MLNREKLLIVVLSRYPDIFEGCYQTLAKHEPDCDKVLVRDGDLISLSREDEDMSWVMDWTILQGLSPFIYARNLNLAWNSFQEYDILLIGDDIRFETPFVEALQTVAYSDPAVGVSTVQLWGQSPYVCGYFKRSVIEAVGLMDERFTGYGKDDNDWCRRMEALGYRTQPTELVKASHGGGTSFLRRAKELGTSMEALCDENNALYDEKWRAQ